MGDKNNIITIGGAEHLSPLIKEKAGGESSASKNKDCEDGDDAIVWEDIGEEDEDARVELPLIGRIWTERKVNVNAFIATIKGVWQPKYGVDITSIGKNLFLFHHWRDKSRVIDDQPWHFDKYALLLGEASDSVKPSDIQLFYLPMWVRVYNLPLKGRLNANNIEKIGDKLGMFVKLDHEARVGIDKSIRIRVLVDVRKPLAKHVKLKLREGIEEFFEVKYEKSPLFCYFCGRIGHGLKDCEGGRGAGEGRRSARALFITKPKQKASSEEGYEKINEVTHRMEDVGLNNEEYGDAGKVVREEGEETVKGECGNKSSAAIMIPCSVTTSAPKLMAKTEGKETEKDFLSLGVTVKSYSVNHIDAWFVSRLQGKWRFSGIYGYPDDKNKHKTGVLMESLRGVGEDPWLCGGDLNLMLHSGEKQGGQEFNTEEAEILRKTMDCCWLEDLGFIGHNITWSNNRGRVENIQERLDRFMENRAWRDTFKGSFVSHLMKRKSDHLPILLCIKDVNPK
uniref:CCHC-type domain-containing protein n=1 Tax=Chenopodium quinoa TaxID=63459 RepID=A0A803MPB9_CHEQI